MNKICMGVSALALMVACGAGAAYANPTVNNVEDIETYYGDVEIGNVEIEVELYQTVYGVEGGEANGGDGHNGGYGGDAKGVNKAYIYIENENISVLSSNNLEAESNMYFENFINTGDNDVDAEGGETEGGDVEGNCHLAVCGNIIEGGEGGDTETGKVKFKTGDIYYGGHAFGYAAGAFTHSNGTGVGGIHQAATAIAVNIDLD